ncbi:MAG: glycoside hydrolase family 3 C-terminal domain-containing protein [Myxococcota bacterium]
MTPQARSEEQVPGLVEALTLEEKVSLLAGKTMWETHPIARLGIPALRMTDGPIGARGSRFTDGLSAACFPCGTALGATWNPALVERLGAALAEEALTKGAHVLLGPTVNIHRSPLAGRNFECYSEDPYLTARTAVAFVRGVQSRGVGACIKHFVCNDSEFERHTISSEVDERTLREIYLFPFEAAVREAGVWSVMAAYNRVNGIYASQHPRLLDEILRREWGFDGFVVSDWGGTQSTVEGIEAGLDLEMPGPGRFRGEKLLEAVRAGKVSATRIDERVRCILRGLIRTGAFEHPADLPERAEDRPEHRLLARRAATEAAVLLKNEGDLLPLDPQKLGSLAVLGPNAEATVIQGGGSAQVRPHYVVRTLDAIRKRCGDGVQVTFEAGCSIERTIPAIDPQLLSAAAGGEGLTAEFFDNLGLEGSPVHTRLSNDARMFFFGEFASGVDSRCFSLRLTGDFVPSESDTYVFGLISAGKSRLYIDDRELLDNWTAQTPGDAFYGLGSSEQREDVVLEAGRSYRIRIEYTVEGTPIGGLKWGAMRKPPADAMERAIATAAASEAAVLIVGTSGEWETEGSDRNDMELPGRQKELIERVVEANPNTVVVINAGSPLSMDWIDRVPAVLDVWFPGQESGNVISDLLFGDASPSGKLPTTFPKRLEDNPAYSHYPGKDGKVEYAEGLLVGYRHYESAGTEPRFSFGHGLSYTSFEYGEPRIEIGQEVLITLDVRNTGSRKGQEVVQLYLRDVESTLPRPEKELRSFAKIELEPGERQEVRLVLDRRAMACYDPARHDWVVEPGEFEVLIGASSSDIRVRSRFTYPNPETGLR